MSDYGEQGGRGKPRPRRSFTPEFKVEIVLRQRGDRSVRQVARIFDLTETAMSERVKQAESKSRLICTKILSDSSLSRIRALASRASSTLPQVPRSWSADLLPLLTC